MTEMVEMRWLHTVLDAGINHVSVKLQYRTRLSVNSPSGAVSQAYRWSDWVDVPTHVEPSTTQGEKC